MFVSYDRRLQLSDEVAVSTCIGKRSTTKTEANYHITCTAAIQNLKQD